MNREIETHKNTMKKQAQSQKWTYRRVTPIIPGRWLATGIARENKKYKKQKTKKHTKTEEKIQKQKNKKKFKN